MKTLKSFLLKTAEAGLFALFMGGAALLATLPVADAQDARFAALVVAAYAFLTVALDLGRLGRSVWSVLRLAAGEIVRPWNLALILALAPVVLPAAICVEYARLGNAE
jgi:hypothetical protein